MLLVDDILLSPVHGLLWVFRRTLEAAQEEMAGAKQAITQELSELYMRLETGVITETEFEEREAELLDRLDAAAAREGQGDEIEEGDDGEGESEEDEDGDDTDGEGEEDDDENDTDDEGDEDDEGNGDDGEDEEDEGNDDGEDDEDDDGG